MTEVRIHTIGKFRVVAGYLVPGGLKRVALEAILQTITAREIVTAVDPRGHSGLAAGLAAEAAAKRATIFIAGDQVDTYITAQLQDMVNVDLQWLPECGHQRQLIAAIEAHAKETSAYLLPIGFNCEPFIAATAAMAKSLGEETGEVWVPVGSGTTLKALKRAWPKATFRTVDLGMMPGHICEYKVPELPHLPASETCEYPAASFYDAKLWRYIKTYAAPGALIWVVA